MSLRETIQNAGGSLKEWTVMSPIKDPFRVDTPANRRDAEWLADHWRKIRSFTGKTRIHARGLHYALVGKDGMPQAIKPNGTPYTNTDPEWCWLQNVVGVARWLGYIPFHAITDNRNDDPDNFVVRNNEVGIKVFDTAYKFEWKPWMPSLFVMLDKDGGEPHVEQAFRLVVIGEKSSLHDVIWPICRRFGAELVLPTGELSTTLLYDIAARAAYDGRPCRVFYLSDFDPTGAHMPIEVSRKLQGLCAKFFPALDIDLHIVGLTAEQVKALGLPETPMKDSERRADKWRERHGCEQTELDALRDGDLKEMLTEALEPFFDKTLKERTSLAYSEAVAETRQSISVIETDFKASEEYAQGQALIEKVSEAIEVARSFLVPLFADMVARVEVAAPDLPEPEIDYDRHPTPLFSSSDSFEDATRKLLKAKL
jgi:hypothetical protein